jgi:hypothetical protein
MKIAQIAPLFLSSRISIGLFSSMPLVSISDAQRTAIHDANLVATVLHDLPRDLLPATYRPNGGYLAFLGRIAPQKGVDRAIEIARQVGIPLKIAAKVDRADETKPSPRCSVPGPYNSSGKSMSEKKFGSSVTRGRSCSRSIGRSRSAW